MSVEEIEDQLRGLLVDVECCVLTFGFFALLIFGPILLYLFVGWLDSL